MTYRSRGRSIFEVILAVCFVGFLVGFIAVLCIGNYFRAKRAQERQRQRRLSKLTNTTPTHSGRTVRSNTSVNVNSRQEQSFTPSVTGDANTQSSGPGYEAPQHLPGNIDTGIVA